MTPVVLTKDGVTFARIAPAGFVLLAALQAACLVLRRDLTITCGTEGHPATDPHTRGEAYDVRTEDLAQGQILALVNFLRHSLGTDFTVLYEVPAAPTGVLSSIAYINSNATAAHLHLQVRKGLSYPEGV